MAKKTFRATTILETGDIIDLFKRSMRSNKIAETMGTGTKYHSPDVRSEPAFTADPPGVSLTASLGGSHQNNSGVELFVWDRGGARELVVAPGRNFNSLGTAAKRKAKDFLSSVQSSDPSARYEEI
jgi:hypothetical protein